jgi:hypothetical protein
LIYLFKMVVFHSYVNVYQAGYPQIIQVMNDRLSKGTMVFDTQNPYLFNHDGFMDILTIPTTMRKCFMDSMC